MSLIIRGGQLSTPISPSLQTFSVRMWLFI